jgi:hypothetical protein
MRFELASLSHPVTPVPARNSGRADGAEPGRGCADAHFPSRRGKIFGRAKRRFDSVIPNAIIPPRQRSPALINAG